MLRAAVSFVELQYALYCLRLIRETRLVWLESNESISLDFAS